MQRRRGRRARPRSFRLALTVTAAVATWSAALAQEGAAKPSGQGGGTSGPPAASKAAGGRGTITPIKHVIVIIGENHTFDNVFGTYQPPAGQTVRNLLSEGIVTASGAPGANVATAEQHTASDTTT